MPLKERNRISGLLKVSVATAILLGACGQEQERQDEAALARRDSAGRAEQRLRADSMKRANPLLIVPPDSTYTGTYVDKYDNGITKFRGFFRFGKRHGQWVSFYPNGNPWSEMHYDKGKREGPNITFFEDGKVRYKGMYRNDARDSIWIYYDSTGKATERVLFKNDRIVQRLSLEGLPDK